MKDSPAKPRSILKWGLLGCGVLMLGTTGHYLSVIWSGSYEESTRFILTNVFVKDTLGEVRGFGLMPSGSQRYLSGDDEIADWEIVVKGARADGVVVIHLTQGMGDGWGVQWAYLRTVGRQRRIDMIELYKGSNGLLTNDVWGPICQPPS